MPKNAFGGGRREVHTRSIDVEVRAATGALWDARAQLIDLRKFGFVPIAGDLQAAGLLHHMCVSTQLDSRSGVLREISANQPAVAFEPSVLSQGESCRDPIESLRALAGTRVTSGFAERLNEVFGGPRGCSHVVSEARLLASTLAWALAQEGATPTATRWRPAERIFRRSATYDGSVNAAGDLELAVQLTDLHFAPAPEPARPIDRLASQTEVRTFATIDRTTLTLLSLEVSQGRRDRVGDELDAWQETPTSTSDLVGNSAGAGWSRRVLQCLAGLGEGAPLSAALLNLAPALFQCIASLSDDGLATVAGDSSLFVSRAPPDSCYMWRKGGAFTRGCEREKTQGGSDAASH